ncbi:MAG: immune inhibitor A, partial [Gemmatimonadetes bacterium]|nr:immune inhibitor A [Gemmatimonadota bacterium]
MRQLILHAVAVCLGGVTPAAAQQPQNERLVTADGVRLDFPPDGVWRVRARRVAAQRARLRSQGHLAALNAPVMSGVAQPSAAAVAGDLWAPAILVGYADTDTGALPTPAQYDSIFYTTQPLNERPYTQRTFYEEMSNGLLHVRGQAYGWMLGAREKDYYLEACGAAPANALDCSTGRSRMHQLFTTALAALDSGVDFGQYDNDGPDGIPNSGDDDGIVDVVQFVQPVVGGECGGRGVWAHKFTLAGIGGSYQTNDRAPDGSAIKVGPYHLVGGVGGVSCTNTGEIMGIGTASHELGHGLGLPDLYDTCGSCGTQGIGEWGLMGSANYRRVVVRELTATDTYRLGPVVAGDTVMLIRPRGANPRGEYFLLENKQAVGSDVVNMLESGSRSKIGGLLVWHIDSLKIAGTLATNGVNAGSPHGVALVQADGQGHLDRSPGSGGNRGDASDPYPGTTNNPTYARTTTPAALKNDDGSFAGFGVMNVTQDQPNGAMSFRFGYATVIRASDTLAKVRVSGVDYHWYEDVISPDSAVTVSVADSQASVDGRAWFRFAAWSDGGAPEHTVTAATVGDTLVANLDANYQLLVTRAGTGTIAASPAAQLETGTFFPAGTSVTLTATSGPDSVFDGWSGDTTSAGGTLVLTMRRPYTLSAHFVGVLAASASATPVAIMGAPYAYDVTVRGGTGLYDWAVQSGQLPPGMYLFTNGRLGGTPEALGTFDFTLSVRSGSQTVSLPMRLTVEAPVIALDAVVAQLLRLGTRLTEDEVRYFDLLGNRNTRLDLGDFLAWVKATGT